MFRLMIHVKFIASRRNPALWEATVTSMQRAVEAAMEQASGGLEPGASNDLQSLDHLQFEEVAIQILSSYSTYHDWKGAVSCPNEYGQTLAHLAVTLGYTRLLERLISWEIDLSVRDATGVTALHFAYLYDHPDCVALLTRNRANQQIRDEPGRRLFAMSWPDDNDISSNEVLDKSSDLAPEHAGSITDKEHVLVSKWLREKSRFNPRQANLFECGTNSFGLADVRLNPQSTIDPSAGAVEIQPPGPNVKSIGMTTLT